MLVDAKSRYIRIAPRKLRLVADLVRGMKVDEARQTLKFTVKRGTDPVLKVLNSAVANAEHNFYLSKENLYIAEIRIDGGPTIKRFRPRARGSASQILKRTSHISIKLGEITPQTDKKASDKKTKTKIEKVYQEARPKEEGIAKEKRKDGLGKVKDNKQETKADKKSIFRRKSI